MHIQFDRRGLLSPFRKRNTYREKRKFIHNSIKIFFFFVKPYERRKFILDSWEPPGVIHTGYHPKHAIRALTLFDARVQFEPDKIGLYHHVPSLNFGGGMCEEALGSPVNWGHRGGGGD